MTGACPNDPADVLCCIETTCANGADTGHCLDTKLGCSGGEFVANLCPGPSTVECCVKYAGQICKNNAGQSGICQDTSATCAGGTYQAGFCPGPSNIECCIKTCPEYFVVGVRGSNEGPGDTGNSGIDAMGFTVAQLIGVASKIIPAANTEYVGIPYPAQLLPIAQYPISVQQGVETLVTTLKAEFAKCPDAKIGVAGYSQGANVVNDALHSLESDTAILDNIKAVLLLADPENDPNQNYDVFITLDGLPATVTAYQGILGAQILPSQVRGVTSSFCLQGDIVCDFAGTVPGAIDEAMVLPIHTDYKSCCQDYLLSAVGGSSFGNRMIA